MARQGCRAGQSELNPAELDRLAGLREFIGSDKMEQALRETHRGTNRHHCRLTHSVMLQLVLALGLLNTLTMREIFRYASHFLTMRWLPGRAALCRARQRLGVAPLRRLFYLVVKPLARLDQPGGHHRGMPLVGIDGTVLDVPDSPENARVFGRHSGGRGPAAFPQVRKLSLVELGTHAELAMVIKPIGCGELRMVGGLFRHLRQGMLLLCDRLYFSYSLWSKLIAKNVQLLFRARSDLVLNRHQKLPDGSYLSKIYLSSGHRLADRDGIVVRVIEYTLTDPNRPGYNERHRLLTTLLDPKLDPAVDLVVLYHERWEHEIVHDEQKTHFTPRVPGKEANVRSETPAGVVQELYALSLAYYVTRAMMADAAADAKIDPRRLSFVDCVRILALRLPDCPAESSESYQQWYVRLIKEMSLEILPPRRERSNPRVVKRKMSKFMKKQPHYRSKRKLGTTFRETVKIET